MGINGKQACVGDAAAGFAAAFAELAERSFATGDLSLVSDDDLARVMTAAVRLYAAKVDHEGKVIPPVIAEHVTPTDAVVMATALIRAAGLNLWDLSMWFQRPEPRA